MTYIFDDQLVEMFHKAATFQEERMRTGVWHWSDNFLREYARCAFNAKFTNTRSPDILKKLCQKYPQWKKYIGKN